MVLAVNWPGHDPTVGEHSRSIAIRCLGSDRSGIEPTDGLIGVDGADGLPSNWPGSIAPPYMNTDGQFNLTIAIMIPGRVLSHPAKPTRAS